MDVYTRLCATRAAALPAGGVVAATCSCTCTETRPPAGRPAGSTRPNAASFESSSPRVYRKEGGVGVLVL